uniref:Uncharacterized protein n=1 Tax=Cacopsylla melanoneura TaxID=428564 RepID=A0A8D8TZ51_9HEMI
MGAFTLYYFLPLSFAILPSIILLVHSETHVPIIEEANVPSITPVINPDVIQNDASIPGELDNRTKSSNNSDGIRDGTVNASKVKGTNNTSNSDVLEGGMNNNLTTNGNNETKLGDTLENNGQQKNK